MRTLPWLVLACLASPSPAQDPPRPVQVTELTCSPREVQPGIEVTFSATLKNTTARLLLVNARLSVLGQVEILLPEAEQILFLEPGGSRAVRWRAKVVQPGFRYYVAPHVVSEGRPMHGAPPAIPEAARAALAKSWAGAWTSPEGFVYGAVFRAQLLPSGAVEGRIDWTLVKAPEARKDYEGKAGTKGVEYVWGVYEPVARTLTLEGYRRDDPGVVLGLDRYRLTIAEDHGEISGATWSGGTWQAAFRLNPQ